MNNNEMFKVSFTKMVRKLSFEFDMSPSQATFALMDFTHTHGQDAIIGMYGFILWAFEHDKKEMIAGTLAHDIAGRGDALMLPKVCSYVNYAKEQLS
jgi:hypothetical protein